MGSEFIDEGAPPHSNSYSETFHEAFPHYLNMGMTYDVYWNGSPRLVKSYRKAHKLKCEHENELAWLNGAYVYNALCSASPLFQTFAKGKVKAHPYPEFKPSKTEKKANETNVMAAKFHAFATQFNKKFEDKQ